MSVQQRNKKQPKITTVYEYAIVSPAGAIYGEAGSREPAREFQRDLRKVGITSKILQYRYNKKLVETKVVR